MEKLKMSKDAADILTVLCVLFFTVLLGLNGSVIYGGFIFLFVILANLLDIAWNKSHVFRCGVFVILTISVSIFCGFRDIGVGTDTTVYISQYFYQALGLHSLNDLVEADADKGFLIISYISTLFGNDESALLISESFFIAVFTFLAVYLLNDKEQKISWSVFVLLWCFTFLNISMNLMRQYCAMSLTLVEFVCLMKKQRKSAIIIQILAYFLHSTSIITIPLFIMFYISEWEDTRKRNWYTIVVLIMTLFIVFEIFTILPILSNVGLVSEILTDRYGSQNEIGSENIFGIGILTFMVLVFWAIGYLKQNKSITEREAYLAYTVHSLFIILRMSAFSVNYLSRISHYYYYFDILMISMLLSNSNISKPIKYGIYLCVCYLWYSNYILRGAGETFPYHSKILGL